MDPTELSDDDLVDSLLTWAARIARAEALLLDLIAELEERELWAQHGVTSCAHWLSWRVGWALATARERCRVARALRSLPLMREALGAGRVSYSQVRAITRVATPEDEPRWLELARISTGAMLESAVRGVQRARAAERDPRDQPPKQAVRMDWDEDGDLVLTLTVPAHEAVAVLAALEQHQAAEQAERDERLQELLAQTLPSTGLPTGEQLILPEQRSSEQDVSAETPGPVGDQLIPEPEDASAEAEEIDVEVLPQAKHLSPLERIVYLEPPCPIGAKRWGCTLSADEEAALARWEELCRRGRAARDVWNERRERLLAEAAVQRVPTGKATLADGLVRLVTRGQECAPVTLQLLVDPLSSWARTQRDELLPPPSVQALVDALPLRRGSLPPALCQYDQGRASRLVSETLRRLLGRVDGERCRFPGCRHTRNLHAHHVRFWSEGGLTDLSNLVLLCSKHHRLLHNQGYVLRLDLDRTLHVLTPNGVELEHHPRLPDASAEALPSAEPFTTDHRGERFDLGYVSQIVLAHAA